jgi:hypothetical protein
MDTFLIPEQIFIHQHAGKADEFIQVYIAFNILAVLR